MRPCRTTCRSSRGRTRRRSACRTFSPTRPACQPSSLCICKPGVTSRCLKAVCATPLQSAPGAEMVYSDLGMMLLGEIVSRAAGEPLDRFLSERLFAPLGMSSTLYKPPRSLAARIPPTEKDPWRKRVVRGQVHDENAFAMGGVAGHAGLFGSARDLAIFADLLLQRGWYDHRRYFSPDTVRKFTAPPTRGTRPRMGQTVPLVLDGQRFLSRGLRPHGLHRNGGMDRSTTAAVSGIAQQPRAPVQGKPQVLRRGGGDDRPCSRAGRVTGRRNASPVSATRKPKEPRH